jgi:hypothetical protein
MNVRDKINSTLRDYEDSLSFPDGQASIEQQKETREILESLNFYTTRLLIFGNDEIEGLSKLKVNNINIAQQIKDQHNEHLDLMYEEAREKCVTIKKWEDVRTHFIFSDGSVLTFKSRYRNFLDATFTIENVSAADYLYQTKGK